MKHVSKTLTLVSVVALVAADAMASESIPEPPYGHSVPTGPCTASYVAIPGSNNVVCTYTDSQGTVYENNTITAEQCQARASEDPNCKDKQSIGIMR